MTEFTKVEILMGFPLGTYSDTPPVEGHDRPVRVSAKEMRGHLKEMINAPVTSSMCLGEHAPSPIGTVTGARIAGNELLITAVIWQGMMPTEHVVLVNTRKVGISPEFAGARIHYDWLKGFRFNGIALVLKEKAAFKKTWTEFQ